jgi:hypothetical protein
VSEIGIFPCPHTVVAARKALQGPKSCAFGRPARERGDYPATWGLANGLPTAHRVIAHMLRRSHVSAKIFVKIFIQKHLFDHRVPDPIFHTAPRTRATS